MDYRFSHNYNDGEEIRFDDVNSEEEAVKKAEAIMAELKKNTSSKKRWDMRARLIKVVRTW